MLATIDVASGLDKEEIHQLTQRLLRFSKQNRGASAFSETEFVSTFETLSPFVTSIIIHFNAFEMIRTRSTPPGTDVENVRQMGYPPSSKIGLQRCNFPGQQILYASSTLDTSLLEIQFTADRPCAIVTQFRLKADTSLSLLPIGELDHYRRHKRTRLGTPGLDDQINGIVEPLDHYDRIAYEFVDAYLADFMSRIPHDDTEKNLYEVTARIANAFLMQDDVDGLIYPSVKRQGGLNYAIKPEVFDKKFEPVLFALTTQVKEYGYGLFEYYEHARGTQLTESGDFIWHTNPHFNARMTMPLSAERDDAP